MKVKNRLYHYNGMDFILKELPSFCNYKKREINIITNKFLFHYSKGLLWFRIFGVGLYFTKNLPLSFSERNDFVKHITIFKWRVKILKRLL